MIPGGPFDDSEPLIVANALEGCQRVSGNVLESASSFRANIPRINHLSRLAGDATPHERLVSSQSFPHLWKKLWKILGISHKAQRFAQFSACFTRAKVSAPPNSGVSSLLYS
jgi:hypothetical protein